MYNLLKGKRGIIFGALDENSIAWKTAERVHEEGGTFVLTNAPVAMRMGQINELAEKTGSQIIPADATSEEDLQNLVEQSMEILGGKLILFYTLSECLLTYVKESTIPIKIMHGPKKEQMFLQCLFIKLCKRFTKQML